MRVFLMGLLTQSAIRGQFRKTATSRSFELNKSAPQTPWTWLPLRHAQKGIWRGHGHSLHYHLHQK